MRVGQFCRLQQVTKTCIWTVSISFSILRYHGKYLITYKMFQDNMKNTVFPCTAKAKYSLIRWNMYRIQELLKQWKYFVNFYLQLVFHSYMKSFSCNRRPCLCSRVCPICAVMCIMCRNLFPFKSLFKHRSVINLTENSIIRKQYPEWITSVNEGEALHILQRHFD